MLQERDHVKKIIKDNQKLYDLFSSWSMAQQSTFLNYVTGARGIKMLYDSFFKEILNPEYAPERLEDLLSHILQRHVRILQILPNDSTRIADESSLLVMDITVEFDDHSIANVEVQKHGYLFPGQRGACYSAVLLLRQYKRIRSEQNNHFSYKNIKNTYTIVLYERSPEVFHTMPDTYIHRFKQTSDTGLKLDLLQLYYFIPLDIFQEYMHNKPISNKLEAWLVFLSSDSPTRIIELIQSYPEFKPMYEDLYNMCLNIEKVMHMYSKELQELDRNTVQYMVDLMQDDINEKKRLLEEQKEAIAEQNDKLAEQNEKLAEQHQYIQQLQDEIARLKGMKKGS